MKTITLSDKVRVSDPCYDDDVWCKTMLTGVLPGKYRVEVEHSQRSGWGTRVASLTVVHEDFGRLTNWEEHGEIGVDSGQAGIFCESSYRNDHTAKDIMVPEGQWSGFPNSMDRKEGDVFYDKMCAFTINGDEGWGSYDTGVVTSSGYGDGGYPLEVLRESNGYIVGMKITYISPEDEEWDDDDQDE